MSYPLSGKEQLTRLAAEHLPEMAAALAAAKAKWEQAEEGQQRAREEYNEVVDWYRQLLILAPPPARKAAEEA